MSYVSIALRIVDHPVMQGVTAQCDIVGCSSNHNDAVIAQVIRNEDEDISVIWYLPQYRDDNRVQRAVADAKKELEKGEGVD